MGKMQRRAHHAVRPAPFRGLLRDGGAQPRHRRAGRAVRDSLRPGDGEHVRDVRDAPHAPVRHDQRAARVGEGRGVAPRPVQPQRDAAGRRHGRRRCRLADDLRSAAPPRLLRRERRRRRADRGPARDREIAQAPAGEDPRRGGSAQAPDGRQGRSDLQRRRVDRARARSRKRRSSPPTSSTRRSTTASRSPS